MHTCFGYQQGQSILSYGDIVVLVSTLLSLFLLFNNRYCYVTVRECDLVCYYGVKHDRSSNLKEIASLLYFIAFHFCC